MIIITDNDGSHDLSVQMAGTKDEVKMPEVGAQRAGPKTQEPVGYSRPVDFSTFIFFFSKCIVSWWDCLPQVGRPLDDLWHCYFCDHYLVSLVTTHITERNGTAMY